MDVLKAVNLCSALAMVSTGVLCFESYFPSPPEIVIQYFKTENPAPMIWRDV
jgi:hypothetical protein